MSSIFISYRRTGTSGYGGRLHEDLRRHFGPDHVFLDVEGIRPGSDFAEALDRAVGQSQVVLALIGSAWLNARNLRRLHDPADFVRLEIESALRRKITVLPVLVEGVEMPSPDLLPGPISQLARTQAIELSDERWDYDLGRLVSALEDLLRAVAVRVEQVVPERSVAESSGGVTAGPDAAWIAGRRRRTVRMAVAAALAVLVVGAIGLLGRDLLTATVATSTTTAGPIAASTTVTPTLPSVAPTPAGWQRFSDATAGYSIAHPPEWKVSKVTDTRTDFQDPKSGIYVRVDWADKPVDVVDERRKASAANRAALTGYEQLRLEKATFKGFDAGLLEWRYTFDKDRLHATNLAFIVSQTRTYAISFQAKEDIWNDAQSVRSQVEQSFASGSPTR